MWKEIILVLSLFSFSFCYTYAPWHQRKFEYSISDMCSYEDNIFQYVKPCPVNYSCNSPGSSSNSHGIEICQATYKTVKGHGATCESDIECDSNLVCRSSKCVNPTDTDVYTITEKSSSIDYVFYCNSGYTPSGSREDHTNVFCASTSSNTVSDMAGYCYKSDGTNIKQIPPSFGKVCGLLEVKKYANNNNHYISSVRMDKIGSLNDGDFVYDQRACKSGFAVPFYPDKTLNDPNNGDTKSYAVCVTYKGMETGVNGDLIIKFLFNNKEYSYNYGSGSLPPNLDTKLQLFKEYVDKSGSLNCQAGQGYDDEQFTCGNDELRRLLYFIEKPEDYLLYKNEDSIIDYLLQQRYPDYKPRYSEPVDASGYLNLKFISLLILLLSL